MIKQITFILFACVLAISISLDAEASTMRSAAAKRAFVKTHACPATGKRTVSCAGYVIDHIYPLCAGGADKPANMQWQGKAESLIKDVRERKLCACIKRAEPGAVCKL